MIEAPGYRSKAPTASAIAEQVCVERRQQSDVGLPRLCIKLQKLFQQKARPSLYHDVGKTGSGATHSRSRVDHRQARPSTQVLDGRRAVGREVAATKLGQRRFAGPRRPRRDPIIHQNIGWMAIVPVRPEAEDALQGGQPDQVRQAELPVDQRVDRRVIHVFHQHGVGHQEINVVDLVGGHAGP